MTKRDYKIGCSVLVVVTLAPWVFIVVNAPNERIEATLFFAVIIAFEISFFRTRMQVVEKEGGFSQNRPRKR